MVFSCGHSIINRSSQTNVGELMLKYGGGGHTRVGTCQIPVADWKQVRNELIEAVREDSGDQPFTPDSDAQADPVSPTF